MISFINGIKIIKDNEKIMVIVNFRENSSGIL